MKEDETKAQFNPQTTGTPRVYGETADHILDSPERTVSDVMRLDPRKLTAHDKFLVDAVKLHGKDFFNYLGLLGSSRELSLAKTKIEEAVMWAVKHITR